MWPRRQALRALGASFALPALTPALAQFRVDINGVGATQIPIVINHRHKYISFGSQDPQLCFRYTLTDPARPDAPPTQVRQRFIFNLAWSPDDFQENKASVEDLFESGELEMF